MSEERIESAEDIFLCVSHLFLPTTHDSMMAQGLWGWRGVCCRINRVYRVGEGEVRKELSLLFF